jgi:hypothetical protein
LPVGYNNLVFDTHETGWPVVFDAAHTESSASLCRQWTELCQPHFFGSSIIPFFIVGALFFCMSIASGIMAMWPAIICM